MTQQLVHRYASVGFGLEISKLLTTFRGALRQGIELCAAAVGAEVGEHMATQLDTRNSWKRGYQWDNLLVACAGRRAFAQHDLAASPINPRRDLVAELVSGLAPRLSFLALENSSRAEACGASPTSKVCCRGLSSTARPSTRRPHGLGATRPQSRLDHWQLHRYPGPQRDLADDRFPGPGAVDSHLDVRRPDRHQQPRTRRPRPGRSREADGPSHSSREALAPSEIGDHGSQIGGEGHTFLLPDPGR